MMVLVDGGRRLSTAARRSNRRHRRLDCSRLDCHRPQLRSTVTAAGTASTGTTSFTGSTRPRSKPYALSVLRRRDESDMPSRVVRLLMMVMMRGGSPVSRRSDVVGRGRQSHPDESSLVVVDVHLTNGRRVRRTATRRRSGRWKAVINTIERSRRSVVVRTPEQLHVWRLVVILMVEVVVVGT